MLMQFDRKLDGVRSKCDKIVVKVGEIILSDPEHGVASRQVKLHLTVHSGNERWREELHAAVYDALGTLAVPDRFDHITFIGIVDHLISSLIFVMFFFRLVR